MARTTRSTLLPTRLLAACAALTLALAASCAAPAPAIAPDLDPRNHLQKHGPSVALFGEHIVYLSVDGKLRTWRTADLAPDVDLTRALASRRLALLAAGQDQLWGTDLSRLYRWSPQDRAWKPGPALPTLPDQILDMVVARDGPVVVYSTHVFDASVGRLHTPPPFTGQLEGQDLRALAVLASGTRIWVGTGYGEWGGSLEGLDLATGEWGRYVDDIHYATGLSEDGSGNVWVSWSMSHFFAHTLVRLHRPDATPERSYPPLEGKYFQTLAWDGAARVLYGVEQNDLVRIDDGKPVKLLSLGELPYTPERWAIGVTPGITGLRVLGPGRLLIIPWLAPPLVYAGGELTALKL